MRIRSTAVAAVLMTGLSIPLAGPALAADRDCPDFASRADAQAAFDAAPGDPERLDADGDGIACDDTTYASERVGTTTGPAATPAPTATAGAGGAAVAARRSPRASA